MEGWIRVQISSGIFGSKHKNYYGILHNQQLMYYDGLDEEKKPTKIAGSFNIQGGTVTKEGGKTQHGNRAMRLVVKDKKKQTIKFDCSTPALWNNWYNAIERSCISHNVAATKHKQHNENRELLGFEPVSEHATDEEKRLSKAQIAKAYKIRAIKAHPDRGGDAELFYKISHAYTSLLAWQAWQDEQLSSVLVEYEAVVEKTETSGMGLSVAFDEFKDMVLVSNVNTGVLVIALTEEADGVINPGDALIAIDDEDCSDWRISRLTSRLGAVRVPVGSTVHFTFSRRKPVHEENDVEFSPMPSPVRDMPSAPTSNHAHDPWDNSYQNNGGENDGIKVHTPTKDSPAPISATQKSAKVAEPDAAAKEPTVHRQAPSAESKAGKLQAKNEEQPAVRGRRASVGVVAAPVDSLSFQNERINVLCRQKADLHGELAQLEAAQIQLHDRVAQLLQMLEARQRNLTGDANMEDELELMCRDLERAQENLLLKRAESRQLASHVSALRYALNRPLVDAVEHIRRSAHFAQIKDENSLLTSRNRSIAYQKARESAKHTLETLLELLDH